MFEQISAATDIRKSLRCDGFDFHKYVSRVILVEMLYAVALIRSRVTYGGKAPIEAIKPMVRWKVVLD